MEELHFGADIGFLCKHFLTKRYEELTEIYDTDYKKTYLFPLWAEIQKEDIDYESELQKFVQKILQFKGETFTLTPEIFQYFTNYIIDNVLKKRKSYIEKVEEKEKAKRLLKIKNELAANHHEYFVLDKKYEKVYITEFGSHFSTIIEILKKEFGDAFIQDCKNWDILDDYIHDNLELGGNWNPKDSYSIKSNTKRFELYL